MKSPCQAKHVNDYREFGNVISVIITSHYKNSDIIQFIIKRIHSFRYYWVWFHWSTENWWKFWRYWKYCAIENNSKWWRFVIYIQQFHKYQQNEQSHLNTKKGWYTRTICFLVSLCILCDGCPQCCHYYC
jgi:hypothetical protein